MIAYKCDICKEFHTREPASTMTYEFTNGESPSVLVEGAAKFDLCSFCLGKVKHQIREWKNQPEKPHDPTN